MIHPFPKPISMREVEGSFEQVDYLIEDIGGKYGVKPIKADLILLTAFEEGAEWRPSILSTGNGVLQMLEHTIPIRKYPEFSLRVLNTASESALFYNSKRGDARESVERIIELIESRSRSQVEN
jgi:hypothetical protein